MIHERAVLLRERLDVVRRLFDLRNARALLADGGIDLVDQHVDVVHGLNRLLHLFARGFGELAT